MMCAERVAAALVLALLAAPPPARAGGADVADAEIPVVGRPTDLPFSEASGKFQVGARAEPTAVQAEQPVTLTLMVTAVGPVRQPPRRIDLARVPAFAERFYIEDPGKDSHDDAARTWRFVYTLKPRAADVEEIPSLPFVYFDPEVGLDRKGFQTRYTDPIALQVRPATPAAAPPRPLPEIFAQLDTGPAVLEHGGPGVFPGVPALAALLLAPPLGCAAWYLIWRRLYPDAARQRRSRAARVALAKLRRPPRAGAEEGAAFVAAAVAGYLRERFELRAAEPTPAEAAAHLRDAGYAPALAQRAGRFFETCDEVRFLPPPAPAAAELPQLAARLILDLEAESWSSLRS